ncbi:MAG: Asp-tRNA(Asn)/Glu-tRNA(Gln) amidotransferase subunit GatA [Bdellovibrionaceae bacterium]|nr:Asp-tRNA(Asn)/Glu-tRNA(Gln) amidotransferase subunit GatA [Pseudobdellovibrionaceae bacterium]
MDFLSLTDIQKNLKEKKITPKELFDFYLNKITKQNKNLNAFISLNDKAFESKKKGLLSGIPLGVKDLFCTQDIRTTAGSKALENYIPPYTATAVKKLEDEGAIIIGKCNNDEFAMGSTGKNSYFGTVKNPWNLKHCAGGSSSGSASAVAGGLCPASLGTDTGGSVRLPAHYCNLVGLKPTYGRVSRYGMIAYASSLDQAGIFTHTVEDSALLLDIISGFDPWDSTSVKKEPPYFQKKLNPNIKNKKILFFDLENLTDQIQPEVLKAFQNCLKILKEKGCQLVEKKWPFLQYGLSAYYLISTSEASSNLSRYDGIRYGYKSPKEPKDIQDFYALNRTESFGKEVRQRIFMGTFCLSAGYYEEYFHKACQVRNLIKQAFDDLFSTYEIIVSPVASSTAPLLNLEEKPLQTYLNDQFTVFSNLIGAPALSLPFSFSKENLPIGIQLMGPPFLEQNILDVAFS